jgi:hypothetical protein
MKLLGLAPLILACFCAPTHTPPLHLPPRENLLAEILDHLVGAAEGGEAIDDPDDGIGVLRGGITEELGKNWGQFLFHRRLVLPASVNNRSCIFYS